jgi:hypothetical protein
MVVAETRLGPIGNLILKMRNRDGLVWLTVTRTGFEKVDT